MLRTGWRRSSARKRGKRCPSRLLGPRSASRPALQLGAGRVRGARVLVTLGHLEYLLPPGPGFGWLARPVERHGELEGRAVVIRVLLENLGEERARRDRVTPRVEGIEP